MLDGGEHTEAAADYERQRSGCHGNADGVSLNDRGGAILVDTRDIEISSCRFEQCFASFGGGAAPVLPGTSVAGTPLAVRQLSRFVGKKTWIVFPDPANQRGI